jgi:ribulose-5-phosphate 4-epimerase/fuculose-1-phosphate aldolase
MDNLESRQAMVQYAHILNAHKYTVGSAGNMSMKLADAVSAAEEFEETAKLGYLGQSLPIRYLTEVEMLNLNPNAT